MDSVSQPSENHHERISTPLAEPGETQLPSDHVGDSTSSNSAKDRYRRRVPLATFHANPEVGRGFARTSRDSLPLFEHVLPSSKRSPSQPNSYNGSNSETEEVRQLRRHKSKATRAAEKPDSEAIGIIGEESRRNREEAELDRCRRERELQRQAIKDEELAQTERVRARRGRPVFANQSDVRATGSMQNSQSDADMERRRRRLERGRQALREEAAEVEELAQEERLRARLGTQHGVSRPKKQQPNVVDGHPEQISIGQLDYDLRKNMFAIFILLPTMQITSKDFKFGLVQLVVKG